MSLPSDQTSDLGKHFHDENKQHSAEHQNWKRGDLLTLFWVDLYLMIFLSDPGVPGPIFVSGCHKQTNRPCVDLTDVTLADEDTNSILTDNANRAIQVNVATN